MGVWTGNQRFHDSFQVCILHQSRMPVGIWPIDLDVLWGLWFSWWTEWPNGLFLPKTFWLTNRLCRLWYRPRLLMFLYLIYPTSFLPRVRHVRHRRLLSLYLLHPVVTVWSLSLWLMRLSRGWIVFGNQDTPRLVRLLGLLSRFGRLVRKNWSIGRAVPWQEG